MKALEPINIVFFLVRQILITYRRNLTSFVSLVVIPLIILFFALVPLVVVPLIIVPLVILSLLVIVSLVIVPLIIVSLVIVSLVIVPLVVEPLVILLFATAGPFLGVFGWSYCGCLSIKYNLIGMHIYLFNNLNLYQFLSLLNIQLKKKQ